jgi:hypothetical protein
MSFINVHVVITCICKVVFHSNFFSSLLCKVIDILLLESEVSEWHSKQGCQNGCPTVKFTVQTSASVVRMSVHVRVYPANAFLSSAPMVKNASTSKNLRGCTQAFAWTLVLSIGTRAASMRMRVPSSLPPPSRLASAWTQSPIHANGLCPRRRSKFLFFIFIFIFIFLFFCSCCRLEKRGKNFGFWFSIPKISELRGLHGRSREKMKVFSA